MPKAKALRCRKALNEDDENLIVKRIDRGGIDQAREIQVQGVCGVSALLFSLAKVASTPILDRYRRTTLRTQVRKPVET